MKLSKSILLEKVNQASAWIESGDIENAQKVLRSIIEKEIPIILENKEPANEREKRIIEEFDEKFRYLAEKMKIPAGYLLVSKDEKTGQDKFFCGGHLWLSNTIGLGTIARDKLLEEEYKEAHSQISEIIAKSISNKISWLGRILQWTKK
ncbi:hypothetical protein [Leptospira phage LE4]|uniref:Uncharacterized protein n=1 Tax=Leptospira phage LE4 TaxID=2041383 RepID=A0A343LEH8_9CAUD|nr:hypothetical protein HWB34_gp75 [Leptospira phage LE4]ATN95088.1 hypothetical protein [Leptospira phage LE4]